MNVGWDNLTGIRPTDIVSVQTTNHWLSKAIRYFERHRDTAWASHSGLVYSFKGEILEALQRVVIRDLRAYQGISKILIHRIPHELTPERMVIFNQLAEKYKNRKYGYLKILAHAADKITGGRYIFRRLIFTKNYPICSWLAAHISWKIYGETFGVAIDQAQPDDILDFMVKHHYPLIWADSQETIKSFYDTYHG